MNWECMLAMALSGCSELVEETELLLTTPSGGSSDCVCECVYVCVCVFVSVCVCKCVCMCSYTSYYLETTKEHAYVHQLQETENVCGPISTTYYRSTNTATCVQQTILLANLSPPPSVPSLVSKVGMAECSNSELVNDNITQF